ncbi:hypothetical protein ANN_21795 [Periplaneta americana]|uniref:Tc1-like transposase DDE domain-containing protein n=1 Tax=Periplaneta americana TaxID=6978 RepID=A0ABQ8S6F0_PERAM|nr:hypothetical protein ANN_21795 [Periplaneta americana]
MVWAGVCTDARTELVFVENGRLTADRYINECLADHVVPFGQFVGDNFVLMHDNARPHIAHAVGDYLQEVGIHVLPWPARSPDMNPFEHVWDMLGWRVKNRRPRPESLQELRRALGEEWELIPQKDIANQIESMPRRVPSHITYGTYRQLQSELNPQNEWMASVSSLTNDVTEFEDIGYLASERNEDDNAGEMNPGSSTESYPTFARIGLRENPGKNLNQRLRVFENKVLRKIFGAKRDEVTGEWRKLHNTELHALYTSPDIIRTIKSRRLRWAGHVARMGESRNAYRVLVGRPEGKRPLGRPRRRWEDNIKMDLREVGYDDRDWINLAQDRDQWRAYVRSAMNLRVP